ncbi:Protein of unknown function [Tranquillimonas rosea]|uniref:DUF3305 domain-containing protein n=1 Tax=Tranquillimonas rosea TaxID=641238 RepID=A0A1H9WB39_9RHOB|nr:DUF3305 domain-containing protein [Tranquillimonas rosea]SES31120.1 Protein of unknown function [Tranquillimonas rosea]
MTDTTARHVAIPLGVIVRRSPGVTRWAAWNWRAVGVLPGAAPAEWQELRRDGDVTEFHARTLTLDLWRTDTEAYLTTLSSRTPSVAVIMRPTGRRARPLDVFKVTASAYESQDYQDSGEEVVELVPMPEGLVALVAEFCDVHHRDEAFVKRRRDRARMEGAGTGKGDPRVRQLSDVYRAPSRERMP